MDHSPSFFPDFDEFQKMMKSMKKRPTIGPGFVRHTIACRFSSFWRLSKSDQNHEKTMDYSPCFFPDFDEFQKMMKSMTKRPTIAPGFVRHTIACRFSSFWRLSKSDQNHEKTMDYIRPIWRHNPQYDVKRSPMTSQGPLWRHKPRYDVTTPQYDDTRSPMTSQPPIWRHKVPYDVTTPNMTSQGPLWCHKVPCDVTTPNMTSQGPLWRHKVPYDDIGDLVTS